MRLTQGLVAIVAIGLLGDVLAAACCGRDACGRAVLAARGAKDSCSSRLVETVTVTPTATVALTSTARSTITSDITLTQVQSDTDLETLTSLATSDFVSTVTDIQTVALTSTVVATVTATADSTVTITVTPGAPNSSQPPVKRGGSAYGVCDDTAYVSACSCIGVRPTTVTQTASAVTVTSLQTITQSPDFQTNTQVLTQTSSVTFFTTITVTTSITQLATVTNTFSTVANTATSLQTIVVTPTATVTAIAPPQCTGGGFNLLFTPSVGGRYGLGYVNSIGEGLFLMAFQGSSRFTVDASGQITNFYANDFQPVVIYSSAHPAYFEPAFKSVQQGYSYAGQQISPVNCALGPAPAYNLQCTVEGVNGGQPLVAAICRNGRFYLHLPGAAAPTDMSCTDISVAASCPQT
ncbi:uncharacterized protein B0I36DRAFT_431550 [Microdochium trichocladiopsis]|uniref:Uncharacterized protein n=1 Tax=Microdochium trichocladiopsis TaxID=1682393 RepID=A0A9P9BUH6_9PEZI|nr:uncharacterized protein B0I36DRAFT_431550 [Microdochium trichocladiopsis]KAH7031444.1 hypothetical protein B0I36DRAFT_431550 [Microdochium trichocladiopsis]